MALPLLIMLGAKQAHWNLSKLCWLHDRLTGTLCNRMGRIFHIPKAKIFLSFSCVQCVQEDFLANDDV